MDRLKAVFFAVEEEMEKKFLSEKLDSSKYELVFYKDNLTEENAALIEDADIISVFIYAEVNRTVIEKAKKLKLIATRSTGFNHIDLEAAKEKNIAVCNVPYYGENTVAEHTFALILALSRNLHKAYVRTINNDFSLQGLRGFDLRGKKLGVIGAGNIGVHVMKMGKGFGMDILAYDVKPNRILEELIDAKFLSLDELLEQSDIITLHCPYNKYTHHLINMDNINRVKPGALFINTARAGIIDPNALYHAVEKGIFGGAGLDVFEGEELVKDENQMLTKNVSVENLQALMKKNLLLRRENVIITPHMAFDSIEAVQRILGTTVENIKGFVENKDYFKVA